MKGRERPAEAVGIVRGAAGPADEAGDAAPVRPENTTGSRSARPPPDAAGLTEELKARARAAGFSLVGVTTPAASAHASFYRSWLERGLHGEMGYLARQDAVARRAELTGTLESVRSVLVVAHEYFTPDPAGVPDDPARGVIARYARGADYHRVMKRELSGLLDWLHERTDGAVRGRAYVDTGPVLERELAQRAGLGWFGRNTMLIHPARGSYFFLGVLLLDTELPPDEPFAADRCGSCRACLDACPTGALLGRDEHGAPVIDARRCISYLTIELRGPIPRELRPAIGNRIYGCDICQEVCPFNSRFARETGEPRYAARGPGERPAGVEALPAEGVRGKTGGADVSGETRGFSVSDHPGTTAPSLVELLRTALNEDAWDAFSRGSAIRRAGRTGLARNVCVGLGNWGSPQAVPVLTSALSDPEPLVRAHAAWALGRIGSPSAIGSLRARELVESDPWVAEEVSSALSSSG